MTFKIRDIIAGTNMKVIEIVLEKTAYGCSPEELHFQHPYLTLGQMYSAHGRGTMQSVTNSKFQTTIHKAVRKNLKLSVSDTLKLRMLKNTDC